MRYDKALDEAKKNVEKFPQFERDGRVWVRVGDKAFHKDWFVRNAVLEEIR